MGLAQIPMEEHLTQPRGSLEQSPGCRRPKTRIGRLNFLIQAVHRGVLLWTVSHIQFIPLLKEKKGYKKIGAVGYCFGGSACIRLASTGLIDGSVICHPGPFSLSQVRAIRIPVSWVCAESKRNNLINHLLHVLSDLRTSGRILLKFQAEPMRSGAGRTQRHRPFCGL